MDEKEPTIEGVFEGLFSTLDHFAGAKAAHQLILARLLLSSVANEEKTVSAVTKLHRDLVADVGRICPASDDEAVQRIRSEVREEINAIVRLVRDGLKASGQ